MPTTKSSFEQRLRAKVALLRGAPTTSRLDGFIPQGMDLVRGDDGTHRLELRARTVEELRGRQVAEISFECKKAKDATEQDHVLTFVGSTAAKDSYGDRIEVKGWQTKRFEKNPVFMPSHNYGELPLGKAVKVWKEDDALMFDVKFAVELPGVPGEAARNWYNAYQGGYAKGVSVGFIPLEWKIPATDEERTTLGLGRYGVYFTKQELIELSSASIPANPEALLQNSATALEQVRSVVRREVIDVLEGVLVNDTDEPAEEPTVVPPVGPAKKEVALDQVRLQEIADLFKKPSGA